MNSFSYKLPVFEGPLDLLLQLIAKNKLDIYDIEISLLLEQYTEQIERMRELDMDIESEFLEMASRLVYIKSASLLPKHEEEAQQLKQELTGQLIEYEECRRTAKMLSHMVTFDKFCREPAQIGIDMTYSRVHKPIVLYDAYIRAAGRGKRKLPPPTDAFKGIVARKIVPVSAGLTRVMTLLREKGVCTYKRLFESVHERSELVASFLAVLELIKDKKVRIDGDGDDALVRAIPHK